jgi:DNA-binding CsgD family transcriptional regulator/catechol 2,3-dioxygenase-like lactoylglutathione lyase family enzyme
MIGSHQRGRPPHNDILTPAEWRVVESVRHGLTNPKIARRMGVSVDAVKYHVANALAKLGLSGKADLRRWDGVSRASPLHGKRRGMTMDKNLQLGPIGQIARTVTDIDLARHWYQDVLGLTHLYSFGNLAFFDCGGVRLFLSEGEDAASESLLYFRVGDIHGNCKALEARGAKLTNAPHMIHRHDDGTEEWMAFFEDNEGRPLALMAQVGA